MHNHKHLNDNLQAEYDKSMISFYVDDVLTETLNSNSKYQLINYKCKNNETVAWDFESYSISVSPFTKKTQCQLYFEADNNIILSFDVNGGSSTHSSILVSNGSAYGKLPVPTRDGFLFDGWYTSVSGGTKILSTDIVQTTSDQTLFAQWIRMNPIDSYTCNNGTYGNEPYFLTYTGDCQVIDDSMGNWRVKLLTDGTLKVAQNISIDAFLVGGGGSGGVGHIGGAETAAGGGGGGGYTLTSSNISLNSSSSYVITVGDGGAAKTSSGAYGNDGENTVAFNLTAKGGYGGGRGISGNKGKTCYGGDGGSGGGGAGQYGAKGGSNGTNGVPGTSYAGGTGQVNTTKEFAEYIGTLYSGAGGGGTWGSSGAAAGDATAGRGGGNSSAAESGKKNTGGGGGGAAAAKVSGAGGSGIVVIRNHSDLRNPVTYNGTTLAYYTGKFEVVDEGSGNWQLKLLTSGILIPVSTVSIDAFLVGGGGSGATGYVGGVETAGGGGGGGGYTTTKTNISLTGGSKYTITIGVGGEPVYTSGKYGNNGTATTAFGYSANGGYGGGRGTTGNKSSACYGGDGGSGGGGAGQYGAKGGTDGGAGTTGSSFAGGIGQTTTTRAFGSGILYSGGGGGGTWGVANNKTPGAAGDSTAGTGGGGDLAAESGKENTGGGGGGTQTATISGAGGSGIVIIRNKR